MLNTRPIPQPGKESPPTFHYAWGTLQAVRNGLGDRAGTCIDPKTQIVEGKTVCLVSCQRSPEPVYLRWKGLEKVDTGDLYVRTGPGSVRLGEEDAAKYVTTRFGPK